ncbi:aprataxin isoform X2 [Daphnia magna]|uniref:aprataxin isoform X1 n=1 Tax=Daphnia magna TaxID=35525 RepID=UPI001E1BCFE4|nr:aprataxin isoform X1 [Daphnia magna]XP_032778833.2 aprataxin isoform X2 [Daphnia magna]
MSANAFKRLMEASKKIGENSPSSKRTKNNVAKEGSSKDTTKKHYWKSGLIQAITDVENIVESSNTLVIIKDKYPKAKFHYLVIPKVVQLNSARELTRSHINLLKEMQEKAEVLVKNYHPKTKFKIGFHAKPSMDHLHLHVVSTDFVSTFLKTKKHWNSFNTEHFLDLPELISKLEEKGNLDCYYPTDKDIELYLKKALKCNQCSFEAKTMPSLKEHLNTHAQSSSKMYVEEK